mgnify:CR=1 FL=1
MSRKVTAALLITAAVLTNAAFTVLGMVFNYPDVLKEPVEEILAKFRASQNAGHVLVRRAGPLGGTVRAHRYRSRSTFHPPRDAGRRAGRHRGCRRPGHWSLCAGRCWCRVSRADASSPDPAVAAAARDSFVLAHRILGNLIGETLGYLFTAAWTLLVLVALGRSFAGLWFIALGAVSAVLVLAGVLSPLDLPVIDLANFIGYVLWSIWLVVFAILLPPPAAHPAPLRLRERAPPPKGDDHHGIPRRPAGTHSFRG